MPVIVLPAGRQNPYIRGMAAIVQHLAPGRRIYARMRLVDGNATETREVSAAHLEQVG
jgi:hypothetical protein